MFHRKKHKIKWAWVQEYGAKNGAHVHILLHVPDDIAALFSPMPLKWVKHILPGAYIADTLQSQIIASAFHFLNAFIVLQRKVRGRCQIPLQSALVFCGRMSKDHEVQNHIMVTCSNSQSQEHLADAYEAALWGKVHYMLKCAPHDLEARLEMTGLGHVRWGQSGVVYGKRLGIWQERKR